TVGISLQANPPEQDTQTGGNLRAAALLETANTAGSLTRQETHSWQTDLPFLSHCTKELEACNSFGGDRVEKFQEKIAFCVTTWRLCLSLNHLRKYLQFSYFSKMRYFTGFISPLIRK